MSLGRPGGYLGGHSGPLLGAQENRVLCANVLDPKGSQKNFMQDNFRLIFRSLVEKGEVVDLQKGSAERGFPDLF